jgi:hypothetical protein
MEFGTLSTSIPAYVYPRVHVKEYIPQDGLLYVIQGVALSTGQHF